jgi:hypothetical protein
MSERDELRLSLLSLGGSISACWSRLDVAGPFDQEKAESAIDAAAEVILAAGYRKPRTITTAEELDALPVGSVLLDVDGNTSRKFHGGWRTTVVEPDGSAWLSDCMEDADMPATVLYEGVQS